MLNPIITNRAILDRNNNKKVRYVTEDKSHSTLTINPILYELVRVKFGDADLFISKLATEVRRNLTENAEKLESRGELFDIAPNGEIVPTTADNWIRGKISHNVTSTIILEIASENLVSKLS